MYWCYCLVFLSCTESCLCLRLCILYFCFYLDCFFIITSFTGFRFNNNKTAYQPQVSETEFLNNKTRHFSHVTKSRIFKNLNLRKKANRNFFFLKNRFRHLKLYSNPPSWLARSHCHMDTFWKTKDWSSHFWESQPFKFWYVEVQRQRRLKSTKTGISS